MKRLQRFLAISGLVLASPALWGPVSAAAQDCSPPHRMRILDLDMRPDPVREGGKVADFRVTLQSDRNGECGTTIEVRDQDQIAAIGRATRILPGRYVYTLQAQPDYRFRRDDQCLTVMVNVGGRYSPVETQQVFCAKRRQITVWSLKEPDDVARR